MSLISIWITIVIAVASQFSVAESTFMDLGGKCTQKNQGRLGTCHAFAMSCPIEAFESRTNPGYSVSENWLVFVSVLDRLCSGTQGVTVNEGYSPIANVSRLMTVGYCSSRSFTSYDPWDNMRSPRPVTLKNGDVQSARLADAVSVFQAMGNSDLRSRGGAMSPVVAEKFRRAFGITWQAARAALCTGSDAEKLRRVSAAPEVSPAFLNCFREAIQKKQKLVRTCAPSVGRGSPAQTIQAIKEKLKRGEPVLISIHEYQPGGNPLHNYHALSVVGFDDRKQQLLVRNSWGNGANYPISYRRAHKILYFQSLNCKPSPSFSPQQQFPPHVNQLAATGIAH